MSGALARHGLVPVTVAIAVGSWAVKAPIEQWTSVLLLSTFGVVWVAEQLAPARVSTGSRWLPIRGGFGHDLIYLTFVTLLTNVLLAAVAPKLEAALGDRVHLWPTEWPFAPKVFLAFLAVELASYWIHRAAHRVPWLWRFHSTHHVIPELTGLKAVRTHPVDNLVFYVARHAPLLLLGAGSEEVVAASSMGALLGVLAHANVEVSSWGLGWVLNLPQFHAVHHSVELDESHSNYGCHTVLWDRVFRTFRPAARSPIVIGVKPAGPRSLWDELVAPFYLRLWD